MLLPLCVMTRGDGTAVQTPYSQPIGSTAGPPLQNDGQCLRSAGPGVPGPAHSRLLGAALARRAHGCPQATFTVARPDSELRVNVRVVPRG